MIEVAQNMLDDLIGRFMEDAIDRRRDVRLPARIASRLRLTLDSAASDEDSASDVTVTDISKSGLSADVAKDLKVGALVTLEVPLLGWREAEVVWIDYNQAGCRFLSPLSQDELRDAIAGDPTIRENFPGLIGQIS